LRCFCFRVAFITGARVWKYSYERNNKCKKITTAYSSKVSFGITDEVFFLRKKLHEQLSK